jgi:hypothetical protein
MLSLDWIDEWSTLTDYLTGGWSLKPFHVVSIWEFSGRDFGMTLVLNRPQHASAGSSSR